MSASLSPPSFLLPPARRPAAAAARNPPRPAYSPSFLSPASTPIKAINPPLKSPDVSPFPLAFFTPGRPAGHQWQAHRPPRPLPASPTSLRPYLSSHSIACASLCPPNTPTRLLELNSPASPPRVPAAAVQAPPSVKDHLRRLPSLLFGFTRGSSSSIGCRFASSEPVGTAPRPRRSAARPAAVAKPRRC
jgi:hypothetical protein